MFERNSVESEPDGETANVLYSNRQNAVSRETPAKKSPRLVAAAMVFKRCRECVWYG
jgi:hypothetical protein